MEKYLTRKILIHLHDAFDCQEWKNNIKEILKDNIFASDDKNILIQDKYLSLAKNKSSKEQLTKLKEFGLSLVGNDLKGAKQFILDKLSNCKMKFIKIEDKDSILYQENGVTLFYLDSKTKEFWFDYDEIYKVLQDKYSLKYNEMKELVNSILEEYLKLKGYTPFDYLMCADIELEEYLKLKGY